MGLIWGTALSVAGIVVAIFVAALSRLLADDFRAWTPLVIERLILLAIAKLPKDQRGRFGEEWRSHIADTPGDLSKVVLAIGLTTAASKMARQTARLSSAVRPASLIGAELRAARQRIGWSLDELAGALRIPVSELKALEGSHLTPLPKTIGRLRVYSSALGLESNEIVRRVKLR